MYRLLFWIFRLLVFPASLEELTLENLAHLTLSTPSTPLGEQFDPPPVITVPVPSAAGRVDRSLGSPTNRLTEFNCKARWRKGCRPNRFPQLIKFWRYTRCFPQVQGEQAFGQAGGVEVLTAQKPPQPFIAALELLAFRQNPRHGSQVPPAVAKTYTHGQAQEGAGQTRQVLADGAAETGKVGPDEAALRSVDILILFHHY